MVPYGDTFLLAGTVTGEVFKFNRDGPAGSKWIRMPENGLVGAPDWVSLQIRWIKHDWYQNTITFQGKTTMLVDSGLFGECA